MGFFDKVKQLARRLKMTIGAIAKPQPEPLQLPEYLIEPECHFPQWRYAPYWMLYRQRPGKSGVAAAKRAAAKKKRQAKG
ncbi:hypothetical protein [Neisseria perflava]|uniref:hypothetical protein n=1 Tax=Neisseria perflava TaxID=33053 RepID=UPI00209EF95A|nr:hypothetical protein [Neisseria perflava]MCP1659321.1 hypothetical protein [Neisseria perflava]